jgi:hypothetical protein
MTILLFLLPTNDPHNFSTIQPNPSPVSLRYFSFYFLAPHLTTTRKAHENAEETKAIRISKQCYCFCAERKRAGERKGESETKKI